MAKYTYLKTTVAVTLLTITALIQIHAESKHTAEMRQLIDRASEARLLNTLPGERSDAVRRPIIQFIEDHERAAQKFSKSNDNWQRVVESMKQNLSEFVSEQPEIKHHFGGTIHSGKMLQMLSEIMATAKQQTKEKQFKDQETLDQKLSIALEKYQSNRGAGARSFKKHRAMYEMKKRRFIRKYGKSLVDAMEEDTAAWYENIVKQHNLKQQNPHKR